MSNDDAVTGDVSQPRPLKRSTDSTVASAVSRAEAVLAGKLLEGLESGDPIAFTDEYTGCKKAAFRERLRASKKKP